MSTTATIQPPSIPGSKPSDPSSALSAAKAAAAPKAIADPNPPKPPEPPEPSPNPPEQKPLNDRFAWDKELDELAQTLPKEPTKPEPKPDAKAKPAEKPDAKPADAKAKKPVDELRSAYESTKAKVVELETEREQLKRERDELKAAMKPANEEELVTLKKQHEDASKRLKELESEIQFTNYAKSQEFKEKYAEPYERAWGKALKELSELNVESGEGATRQATAQDLISLCNLPLGEARMKAKEMFGEAADDVMAHRRVIRDLHEAQVKALDDAKVRAGEREKQMTEQHTVRLKALNEKWGVLNKQATEKYPQWFAPDEADPEGNKLLERGYALADKAFSGDPSIPPEQLVEIHSAIRNKAGAFDRLVARSNRLSQRVQELETELAQYKKSEPTKGDGEGRADDSREKTIDEEIDALVQ